MKIAVCFSGQPRYLEYALPEILDNILATNSPDVFYHAWYSENDVNLTYDSSIPQQSGKMGSAYPNTDKILEHYLSPKKSKIENQIEFDIAKTLKSAPTALSQPLVSQFYSIQQADKLRQQYEKENGFEYDIVIKTRFDLYYGTPLIIKGFKHLLSDNILLNASVWQSHRMGNIDGLGDYTMNGDIVIANSKAMTIFSNLFDEVEKINEKINPPYAENYFGMHNRINNSMKVIPVDIKVNMLYRVLNSLNI